MRVSPTIIRLIRTGLSHSSKVFILATKRQDYCIIEVIDLKYIFGKFACRVLSAVKVFMRALPAQAQLCPGLEFDHAPVSKSELRGIAREGGITAEDPWQEFEYYSLLSVTQSLAEFVRFPDADFLDTPIIATGLSRNRPFPSDERGGSTNGQFQTVFPDGYGLLTRTPRLIPPGETEQTFADSVLYEVKALTNKMLTLEYPFDIPDPEDPEDAGKFQILGLMDAASETAASQAPRSLPIVAFLTTSDVSIGMDVLDFGYFNRVAIAQYISYNRFLFPTRAEIRMSAGIIRNPSVYTNIGQMPGELPPGKNVILSPVPSYRDALLPPP